MLLVALLLGSMSAFGGRATHEAARRPGLEQILDAIRVTETGGCEAAGRHASGDGGRAIGPYQIHRSHWVDSGLAGRWEDCRDPGYARREMLAYWKRWCPDALARVDAETLVRVHNGGPRGAEKRSTLAYWNKVRGLLGR